MKIKFRNIITESVDFTNVTKLDKKLLKFLTIRDVSPYSPSKVVRFLRDVAHIDDDALVSKVSAIYVDNYREDGNYGDLNSSNLESDENTEAELILSDALNIHPYWFKELKMYTTSGYRVSSELPGLYYNFLIFPSRESANRAAWNRMENNYNDYTIGHWDEGDYEDYITIDEDALSRMFKYGVERKYDTEIYDEDGAREFLGEYELYIDLREEKIELDKELDLLKREIQQEKYKLGKIEKEKEIINREIERLGGYIEGDYEEDDYPYDVDLDKLQYNYNRMETYIYEKQSYLDELFKELDKKQRYYDDVIYDLGEVTGDEVKRRAKKKLKEELEEEFESDKLEFLRDVYETDNQGLINDGRVEFELDEFIKDYLYNNGVGSVLSDNNEEIEHHYEGNTYYIYKQ
jgi:hypothetical protein